MTKIKAFVSYSHKDKRYFDEFKTHLKGLERIYEITNWYDGKINAGEKIDDSIIKNLYDSDVIFLLISPYYIESYYCFETELKRALLRCSKGECVIIPILIKKTANIDQFEFSKYKMLPTDATPVSSFRSISDGFSQVIKDVFSLLQDHFKQTNGKHNKCKKVQKDSTKNQYCFKVVSRGQIKNKSFNPELYLELKNYVAKIELLEKRLSSHLVNSIFEFQKQYENNKSKKKYVHWHSAQLKAFSLQLLEYTKRILDNNILALHIRWLKKNSFVSFVDAGYKDNPALSVRALPEDDPMISTAYSLNMPIIKSMNMQLHKTNHIYEKNNRDYITCAFSTIRSRKQVELTLCISCERQNVAASKNQLLILSFCRIDKKIEAFILSYIEACAKIDNRYSLKKIGDAL